MRMVNVHKAKTQLPKLLEAVEAGEEILVHYAGDRAATSKADDSPLTAADLASHRRILAGLEELDPGTPVISEESEDLAEAAAARGEKNLSMVSRPVNARPVNPPPASQRNSRRVRRQNASFRGFESLESVFIFERLNRDK